MTKFLIVTFLNFTQSLLFAQETKYWTLKNCVDYALETNTEIQRQQVDVAMKTTGVRIAKKERLPSITGYSNVHSIFGRSQDIFGNIQRNDNLNSNMGLTSEIMLYNFGALKSQARKSKLETEIAELEMDIIKRTVTIQIVQAYLELLLKQSILQTHDSAVTNAHSLHMRAKLTYEAGSTSQSELYEAKATLVRAQQEQAVAKLAMDRAKLNLAQLMLLDDHSQLLIKFDAGTNTFRLPNSLSESDAYSASYIIDPKVKQIGKRLLENEMERKIIRGDRHPRVTGSATFGSTYFNPFAFQQRLGNFFTQTGNNFAQQVAITANIPIFNKGQTRLKLKQIDLSRVGIELDEQLQKQEIRKEIQQILFDFRSNQEQYIHAKEVLTYTEKAMEFAKKSYEAGRSSIYDYNNSRNNFIQAQNAVLEARYSTIFSYKMLLYQTTGSYDDE
ncbi:TolC family protein [Sphingobacterium paludis]|uniref:Outer membrane protein n=1 Tax=Sphingobacterium paludis TaxID=1476465 RepID=A0A4R7D4Q2_9SPHI|nr:TolC family protein [Sphingobacterium paludis]TDS16073.1 outer membrane protein [Sphingobacterium paludis]